MGGVVYLLYLNKAAAQFDSIQAGGCFHKAILENRR